MTTYTVKHSHLNPRNNSTVECETMHDAISEALKYSGEPVDSRVMDETGRCVAYRDQGSSNVEVC
jgi:hypothetical protein